MFGQVDPDASSALIVAGSIAIAVATALAGLLNTWYGRRNPAAQANNLIATTYGLVIEDLREELAAVRVDLRSVHAEVLECERAREAQELELAAVKRQLAELLEQNPL